MRTRLAILAVALFAVPAARADIMFIDPIYLVDQADLVVVGKVTKIEEGENGAPSKFTVAVSKVLKGGKVETVTLRRQGATLGTGRRIETDREAVMMLRKDGDAYELSMGYPMSYRELRKGGEVPAELVKLIAEREALKGGEAVGGLSARAEVVSAGEGVPPSLRFSLRNVSDKPVTVCTWVGLQPLKVKWVGPDGKEIESKHYEWLKAARLRPAGPEDFVTLQPGGVVHIGSSTNRFAPGIQFPMAPAGENSVTLSFEIAPPAGEKAIADAWAGRVTAPAVKFTVK